MVLKTFSSDVTPAARVGVQPGDIVKKINDFETPKVRDVIALLKAGESTGWRIAIRRGENIINVMVGR